jgi:hypothetical protein
MMDLEKHRERCERWPIERVKAKASLLLYECVTLHGVRKSRLRRLRQVRAVYDAKLDRRDLDEKQARYDARWANADR